MFWNLNGSHLYCCFHYEVYLMSSCIDTGNWCSFSKDLQCCIRFIDEAYFSKNVRFCLFLCLYSAGANPGFQARGGRGVLKIISPSGGRRENFGGISWIQPLQCLWLLTLFGKQVRKSYHTKIVVFYNDISVKIYTCHEQYLQLGLTWCTHIDIKL